MCKNSGRLGKDRCGLAGNDAQRVGLTRELGLKVGLKRWSVEVRQKLSDTRTNEAASLLKAPWAEVSWLAWLSRAEIAPATDVGTSLWAKAATAKTGNTIE